MSCIRKVAYLGGVRCQIHIARIRASAGPGYAGLRTFRGLNLYDQVCLTNWRIRMLRVLDVAVVRLAFKLVNVDDGTLSLRVQGPK